MIRVEADPMGMGGEALHLSEAADLAELDAERARLVPERVRALFRGFPDSMTVLASEAPIETMAMWLTSLRDASCVLEINTTDFIGDSVRLRFHFDERWAPSFSAVAEEAPPDVPAMLEAVHRLIGDVDTQFGCSGTLVPFSRMDTVGEIVADQRVLNFDLLADVLRARPELGSYRGFFEADGDWLCVGPRERTLWLGGEWSDSPVQDEQPLATVLDAFFRSLGERRYFRAGLVT